MGAKSDPRMLQKEIFEMTSQKVQIMFYDSSGYERSLIISCSPFYESSNFIGCLIILHASEAITLQEALTESTFPRILVSSSAPYSIHMANDAFLHHVACSRCEALGRPLQTFSTFIDLCEDPFKHENMDGFIFEVSAVWSGLLSLALDGRVASHLLTSSDAIYEAKSEAVTLVPVVEAPNGHIRHLLITFGPRNDADGRKELSPEKTSGDSGPSTEALPGQSTAANRRGAAPQRPTAGSAAPAFFVCPTQRTAGPAIFPRRKVNADGTLAPAAPVVVTRELVAALADLPLHEAAAAAGVSATAFKKACRKLGIKRWAYKRRRPAAAGANARKAAAAAGASLKREPVGAGAGDASDDGGDSDCGADSSAPEGPDTPPAPLACWESAAHPAALGVLKPDCPKQRPQCPSPHGDEQRAAWAPTPCALAAGAGAVGEYLASLTGWASDNCGGAARGGSGGGGGVGALCGGGADSPRLFAEPAPPVDDALVLNMLRARWELNG